MNSKKCIYLTILALLGKVQASENMIQINGKDYTEKQVLERCAQVKKQFAICDKLKNKPIEDPIYGDYLAYKKDNSNFSLLFGYNLFGDISGINISAFKEFEHFSIGINYASMKISESGSNEGILKGSSYGLVLKYSFTPNYILKSNTNIYNQFVYVNLGKTKLKSSSEGDLPEYIHMKVGMGLDKQLYKNLSIYSSLEFSEIYHSDSGLLHLGTTLNIGFKFNFGN